MFAIAISDAGDPICFAFGEPPREMADELPKVNQVSFACVGLIQLRRVLGKEVTFVLLESDLVAFDRDPATNAWNAFSTVMLCC